jgi:hypothetical protein
LALTASKQTMSFLGTRAGNCSCNQLQIVPTETPIGFCNQLQSLEALLKGSMGCAQLSARQATNARSRPPQRPLVRVDDNGESCPQIGPSR